MKRESSSVLESNCWKNSRMMVNLADGKDENPKCLFTLNIVFVPLIFS